MSENNKQRYETCHSAAFQMQTMHNCTFYASATVSGAGGIMLLCPSMRASVKLLFRQYLSYASSDFPPNFCQ